MAEKSTFFNSVNGDRKYTAEDMAAHFAKMLTNGVMPAGTQLQVIEDSGMNVAVSAGSAWINGYAYHNDSSFVLTIDPADGALNRVDRIVVRWSKLARSINLIVLKGTPASSAVAPDIVRNADYYDLSIATINVNKGVTAITQALITDTRMDSDVCGFVSSLIQPDTSGWFVQFETAFNEWFDGVKDTLGDNAAGQLQNQINQLKDDDNEIRALETKLPDDVATALELDPTTNPQVKDGLLACAPWRLLKAYTVAGAYTFTVPDNITKLGVFIIGSGGSGAVSLHRVKTGASGGGSGYTNTLIISRNLSNSYSVVVGAGGQAVSSTYADYSGKKGGSSSFNGVVAEGGNGGNAKYAYANEYKTVSGAKGGQGSSSFTSGSSTPSALPAFGYSAFEASIPNMCINHFNLFRVLIAGGGASAQEGYRNFQRMSSVVDGYGRYGSSGAAVIKSNATAIKGTAFGCGGGGAAVYFDSGDEVVATSAAGADGAVLIYGR